MPRLDRQSGLFEPSKLAGGRVTIFGDGPIANHLVAYLTGLGVGKINLVGKGAPERDRRDRPAEFLTQLSGSRRKEKVKSIAETASRISEEMGIKPYYSGQDIAFTLDSQAVVDTTNDPESKYRAFRYCEKTDKLFISCASNHLSTSVTVHPSGKGRRTSLERIIFNEYDGLAQGSFTSGTAAAVAADEIRKELCPVEGDVRRWGTLSYSLLKGERSADRRLSKLLVRSSRNDMVNRCMTGKKALVVGAGGIGTHAILSLAALFADIEIYDDDSIEDHNLNRQFLYFDAIGDNKAETTAKRVRKINPRISVKGHPCRVTEDILMQKRAEGIRYDMIFSCVDTWAARRMLDRYCRKTATPLFDAGVGTYQSRISHFIPGKTHCLECRTDLKKKMDRQDSAASCADLPANVVMPNAIAGALMVGEALQLFAGNKIRGTYNRTIEYDSNSLMSAFSIETDRLLCRNRKYLRRGCRCHEYMENKHR